MTPLRLQSFRVFYPSLFTQDSRHYIVQHQLRQCLTIDASKLFPICVLGTTRNCTAKSRLEKDISSSLTPGSCKTFSPSKFNDFRKRKRRSSGLAPKLWAKARRRWCRIQLVRIILSFFYSIFFNHFLLFIYVGLILKWVKIIRQTDILKSMQRIDIMFLRVMFEPICVLDNILFIYLASSFSLNTFFFKLNNKKNIKNEVFT